MAQQKATLVKKMIGKRVEWEVFHDRDRGTCIVRSGVVREVKGRNVLIGGCWEWIPSMTNLKLLE